MFGKLAAAALVAASLTSVAAPPAFASEKADVEAAIRKTMQYANTGNDAGFMEMLAPSGVVIDEFAPFHWNGLAPWAASYGAYNRQNAVAAPHTTLLGFKRVLVDGDRAYAALRVIYSYRVNGISHKEPGIDLFTLVKTPAGWRCDSFAWFSTAGVDAGTEAAAVEAAVRAEFDGFNAGTVDFAKLPWKGIIDEFPTYAFSGAATVADWGAGFQKTGQTDTQVDLGAPVHLSVNNTDAYIVFPAVITGKVKGKPIREKGRFVFTLTRATGIWQTRSWAWTLD